MFAKIKEIFESIQGEGILVGLKQIFVRLRLPQISYCIRIRQ